MKANTPNVDRPSVQQILATKDTQAAPEHSRRNLLYQVPEAPADKTNLRYVKLLSNYILFVVYVLCVEFRKRNQDSYI
jgi:hypothetical protein